MEVTHNIIKSKVKISTVKLETSSETLNRYIDEIRTLGDQMKSSTNIKALMTSYKIFNQTKVFDDLLKTISDCFHKLQEVTIPEYDFVIMDAWGVIYEEGEHAIPHKHLPSTHSFVYYLNDTEVVTPLIFTESDWYLHSQKNDLVIFPSHLEHYVPEHKSNPRAVLAGNFGMIRRQK